jgi:hypothetical protein
MVALWVGATGGAITDAFAASGEAQKLGDGAAVVLVCTPVLGELGRLGRKLERMDKETTDE